MNFKDNEPLMPLGPRNTPPALDVKLPKLVGVPTNKISYTDPTTGKVNIPLPAIAGRTQEQAIAGPAPQPIGAKPEQALTRLSNGELPADAIARGVTADKVLSGIGVATNLGGMAQDFKQNRGKALGALDAVAARSRAGTPEKVVQVESGNRTSTMGISELNAAQKAAYDALGFVPKNFGDNPASDIAMLTEAKKVRDAGASSDASAKLALAQVPLQEAHANLYKSQGEAAKTTARAAELKALLEGKSNKYDSSPGLDPTMIAAELIKAMKDNPDNKQFAALYDQLFPGGRPGALPWKNRVARHASDTSTVGG